ncbi:hypothetical protein [Streptomyces sp. CB03238]|uniref:DODA-type extradiol aromatic ring-opening family dioxygenase n=1 Tax=Streptomyces sp. CB03238 TaxID=1907777 RepID=UPI000A11F47F|nr:hypothetical protein [Streptomyces sp. CB03238]ORT56524.1 hypothetical protein BKD26_27305 [Streptomyces sp. CB03238]
MARVVAAFAASHAPMMLAARDIAPAAQRDRFFDGLGQAVRRVREGGAEAVVVISNEHFTNFFLGNFPQHCVGLADRHTGPAEPWLPMPHGDVPGHSALAHELTRHLLGQGFEPALSHDLHLDHGVMTVYHAVDETLRLPLVPILQNCAVAPMPALRRCHELGAALGKALAECTAVDRVAVVAAGGLSHTIGTERVGEIDTEFDRWFLDRMAANRFDDVLDMADRELEAAGNGAHEIRSWLTLAGLADRPARILAYEPVQEWITGMGVADYDLSPAWS